MSAGPLPTYRFEDYLKAHAREHELIHRAEAEAKLANDYRLAGLNELRKEVERDRSMFAHSKEVVIRFESLGNTVDERLLAMDERMRKVEKIQAERQSSTVTWIIAIGIIFTVVQIALRFI